jgi:hypothetical protein
MSLLCGASSLAASPGSLDLVSALPISSGGAEIVAWDGASAQLLVTSGSSIEFIAIDEASHALRAALTLDLGPRFPWLGDVSSVAIDPAGRGFAAAALIPTANTTQRGRIAFIDLATRSVITTLEVGYHPDCVAFSPNGTRLITADEGERSPDASREDPPGGISVIDLSAIVDTADLAELGQSDVRTYDFSASTLAPGVSLDGLRIAPERIDQPLRDIEPEYIAATNEDAWVSLQENNALARFNFGLQRWDLIVPLGTRTITIDASDKDNAIESFATVPAMPMPDTIVHFRSGGRDYLATVDEGDTRDTDEARAGSMPWTPSLERAMTLVHGTEPRSDAKLGRLKISIPDSDPDGDGVLDRLVAFGTRSFSIYDWETGALVYESGGLIESVSRTQFPALFNANTGSVGERDARSDDRGPEPESLAVATIGGVTHLIVGLERPGPLLLFDVSDPTAPRLTAITNHVPGDRHGVAPEGSVSFTLGGETFLAVAYEVSGTAVLYRLGAAD